MILGEKQVKQCSDCFLNGSWGSQVADYGLKGRDGFITNVGATLPERRSLGEGGSSALIWH
jgi:hypothetical protein